MRTTVPNHAKFNRLNPNQAYFIRNMWRNITGQNRAAAQATAEAEQRAAELARQQAAAAEAARAAQAAEADRQMRLLLEKQQQLVGVVAPVRKSLIESAGSTRNLLIIVGVCLAAGYFLLKKK